MKKMYVYQHRDYGASWFDEDTAEEIGGVSDADIVVSIDEVNTIIAQRDQLREALNDLRHASDIALRAYFDDDPDDYTYARMTEFSDTMNYAAKILENTGGTGWW